MNERSVAIRGGKEQIDIVQDGGGPPLVFLPDVWGLKWDPLLEDLAKSHAVTGVRLPGTGGSSGDEWIIDIFDLIYLLTDLFDELQLEDVALIGQGLGGMIAAELAAMQPERYRSLVLIAPYGLWNEDHPNTDIFFDRDRAEVLRQKFFKDPQHPFLDTLMPQGDTPQEQLAITVETARQNQVGAKYLWPLPERGLVRRIHRVVCPTLIVWGTDDGTVPAQYADDFKALIKNATTEIVPNAGHWPQVEAAGTVVPAVNRFLADAPAMATR